MKVAKSSVEQLGGAEGEVPGDHPDLVAMGREALDEEVDVERRLHRALVGRGRVDGIGAEVVAEPPEEGGAGRLLQVDEEAARRARRDLVTSPRLHPTEVAAAVERHRVALEVVVGHEVTVPGEELEDRLERARRRSPEPAGRPLTTVFSTTT